MNPEDAARRWGEAGELLRRMARAPGDLRQWLGAAWSGEAARAFDAWTGEFHGAAQRVAAALDEAARAAAAGTGGVGGAAGSGPGGPGRLGPSLDELERALRGLDQVRVPGEQRVRAVPAPPRPVVAGGRPAGAGAPRQAPARQPAARQAPPRKPASLRSPPHKPGAPEPASREPRPRSPGRVEHRTGRVEDWVDQAIAILRRHGYRDDQLNPEHLATIIRYESAGDPGAVNGWDGNASRGTPSMGLMQTIRTSRHRDATDQRRRRYSRSRAQRGHNSARRTPVGRG
jgi:uncharacterized protein YukE